MSEHNPRPSVPLPLLGAGLRNLVIDRVTVEVSRAFAARGIPSVVLKGPAIANWLYGPHEVRAYGDTDLLIPHELWSKAVDTLAELGFEGDLEPMGEHPRMASFASHPFVRQTDSLDLHSTLHGVGLAYEDVWPVLSRGVVPMEIGGAPLDVLAPAARTVHVALHAAQHQDGKAVFDLEKAVAQLDYELWTQAAELARELRALPAFSAGLRLVEGGRPLAESLGIADVRSLHMEVRAQRVPLAEGIAQIYTTRGLRAKLRLLWRELFPRPAFMRWWSPLANRGGLGLALAYLWRPIWLVAHLPRAVRTVRRARQAAAAPDAG
ncbi:MAG TPA: nucleotidyltransferase family protein [Thermoleophilaceae bacterium]|nr:nucleotidyltransferase family protein [Thermoleophilaceae bacterium]